VPITAVTGRGTGLDARQMADWKMGSLYIDAGLVGGADGDPQVCQPGGQQLLLQLQQDHVLGGSPEVAPLRTDVLSEREKKMTYHVEINAS